MKNIVTCLVFAAVFAVSPLAAFSMDDTTTESPKDVLIELSGEVVSVDVQEQQAVIEYQLDNQGAVISAIFYFSETVEIYKNAQAITASELKQGDKVAITYQIDENGAKVIKTLVLEN